MSSEHDILRPINFYGVSDDFANAKARKGLGLILTLQDSSHWVIFSHLVRSK